MRFAAISTVVETEADDETIRRAIRAALASINSTPQFVLYSPDGDTIAEAMGMPGETVDVIDVEPAPATLTCHSTIEAEAAIAARGYKLEPGQDAVRVAALMASEDARLDAAEELNLQPSDRIQDVETGDLATVISIEEDGTIRVTWDDTPDVVDTADFALIRRA